jgi:hypothetical protein
MTQNPDPKKKQAHHSPVTGILISNFSCLPTDEEKSKQNSLFGTRQNTYIAPFEDNQPPSFKLDIYHSFTARLGF